MVFHTGSNVLSAIIHLLGVSVLAHLISRRAMLRGNSTLRDVSWPWLCVLLIFVDSWLFIFSSGILVLGSGLEGNNASCSMGILLCIIFYGSSKFLIYVFLCTPPFHTSPQGTSLSPMQRNEFTSFGDLLPNHSGCSAKRTLRAPLFFWGT
jgi:hypothetical protein